MKKVIIALILALTGLFAQAQYYTDCSVIGQLSANVGDTITMTVNVGTWTTDTPQHSIVLIVNTCNATLISDEVVSFLNYTLIERVKFIATNAGSLQWRYIPDMTSSQHFCGSSCTVWDQPYQFMAVVYPNPAQPNLQYLKVENGEGWSHITIYSPTKMELKRKVQNGITYLGLKSGIYYYTVVNKNNKITKKLVVE